MEVIYLHISKKERGIIMIQNGFNFIGRLTKEAYYSPATGEKKSYSNFDIAVDRNGRDSGADFISLVAFGVQADYIGKYATKGTLIAVSGRIDTSKEIEIIVDGKNYKKHEAQFIIEDVKILAQPSNNSNNNLN